MLGNHNESAKGKIFPQTYNFFLIDAFMSQKVNLKQAAYAKNNYSFKQN